MKNYDEESRLSIKKLSLASNSPVTVLSDEESFETESLLTSVNADYYEFVITDGEVTGPPSAEESSIVPDKILKYVAEKYADNYIVKIEHKWSNYQVELNNDVELVFNKDGDFKHID